MNFEILLDMDGVVSNLAAAVCIAHGLDPESTIANSPEGEFMFEKWPEFKETGIDTDKLWEGACGRTFWNSIKPYDGAYEFYSELVCKYASEHLTFSTSPNRDPECASGKIDWLRKFTRDPYFRWYSIGPRKYLMANSHTILIDDSDKNIRKFKEHGGHAVLVPRRWNSRYGISADLKTNELIYRFVLSEVAYIVQENRRG